MRLIAFSLLILGSSIVLADSNPNSMPAPLPGGYVTASVTDASVQAAAEFAAQQINQGTVVQIISAQSQVVAGINYRMRLLVADPKGQQATYDVVVFVPLPAMQAPMQLTSSDLITNVAPTSVSPTP